MFLIYLYKLLTILAQPFAEKYIKNRLEMGKEMEDRYREKFAETKVKRPNGVVIWFNAASIGELNIVIPLVKVFHKNFPKNVTFLITTTTVGSNEVFKRANLPASIHQFTPLDTPKFTKRFLNHWKPNLAVFVESEIWPNMIVNTKSCHCPLVLINGRLSEKSFERWKKIKSSMKVLLGHFRAIFPGTEIDRKHFEYFESGRVEQVINLKNSSPPIDANHSLLSTLRGKLNDRKVVVYASTHQGEEEEILKAHIELKKKYSDLVTIIVPRHIVRAKDIQRVFDEHNLSTAIHSETKLNRVILPEIYIVDTVGELGTFYRLGGVAFVGGSLIKHGGHNILEPAKIGCAILCGPHAFNFKEIVESFKREEAVIIVEDYKDIVRNVVMLFEDENVLKGMQYKSLQISQKQDGFMQQTVSYLCSLVPFINN